MSGYIRIPVGDVLTYDPLNGKLLDTPAVRLRTHHTHRVDWGSPTEILISGRAVYGFWYRGEVWAGDTVMLAEAATDEERVIQGFIFEERLGEADPQEPSRIALRMPDWQRLATKVRSSYTWPVPMPRQERLIDRYRALQAQIRALHGHLATVFEHTDEKDRKALARQSVKVGERTFYLYEILGLDIETGAPIVPDSYAAPLVEG